MLDIDFKAFQVSQATERSGDKLFNVRTISRERRDVSRTFTNQECDFVVTGISSIFNIILGQMKVGVLENISEYAVVSCDDDGK